MHKGWQFVGESFWWRFCCLVTVLQCFETISEPFYVNSPFCLQDYVSVTFIIRRKSDDQTYMTLFVLLKSIACFFYCFGVVLILAYQKQYLLLLLIN